MKWKMSFECDKCWGRLAILVITAAASVVGCIQSNLPNGFNLTAVTMPGDLFYDQVITSSSPGELCFRIRDRNRKIALSNSRFAMFDYGDIAGLTMGNQVDNLPEDYKPACLLPAGEMLYGVRYRDSSGEFSYNIVLSTNEGTEELLFSDLRSTTGMRGVPSSLYDREYGLAMFVPDFEQGFTVWDTSVDPGDMQFISDVVAFGNGFRAGNLTQVFVKADGQVLAYDPELKQAVLDPALQWLGSLAEVCDIALNNGHEYPFSFAAEVAAVRLSDHILLIDSQRSQFEIKKIDVGVRDYRGLPRPARQQEAASADFLFYKDEGRRVSVKLAGKFCTTLPVDDARLAVFDKMYQRLIIVAKATEG